VQLRLPVHLAEAYKSPSQRTRLLTETWAAENLYCPSCDADHLQACKQSTPVVDFFCAHCSSIFQLKSQSKPIGMRILDAAYQTMVEAIRANRVPNLWALQYDPSGWRVQNVLLIPSYAFSLSCIEQRKPLQRTARRAGWVGCNIVISSIPADARIPVVTEGKAANPSEVRRAYRRLVGLTRLDAEARGWTLDVLHAIRRLGKDLFSLQDVYALEEQLAALHPQNRHIRPKIRQQLQRLRDMGLVEFLGGGRYRVR
jgi:type II restriction enzyme